MTKVKNNQGFGIIEIIITLSIAVIIVMVIGQVLASVYKVYHTSELKTLALIYAQQPIEIINGFKNDFFGCICPGDIHCDTCIYGGQSCDPLAIYASCWTEYPAGLIGQNRFYLLDSGTSWQLNALSPGIKETITANPNFSREITIENLKRNADGDFDHLGTPDFNTKKVTVTVYWQDRSATKNVSLSTIFTAWENL